MKYNKQYGMRFYVEPEEGGGNGGEEPDEPDLQKSIPEPKVSAPTLDPKAFAQEFGTVLAEKFKERDDRQVEKKSFSPEEIAQARKDLGIFEPDEAWLTRFDNLDTRKQAILEMRDAMLGSQNKITQALIAQQEQTWKERFEPVHQMLTQREETERVSRFHGKYPQLSDENLQPLIQGVGSKLAASGTFKGLTESQAFDKLAQGVESVIKTTYPSFSLTKQSSGKSSNEIPVETAGGRGGGGHTDGGAKPDSPNGLFGPVRPRKH